MTKDRSVEEPCAGNLASTVLKTSGESDLLAEFDRILRPVVIQRKNSRFFKTEHGAAVSDVILSTLQTCSLAKTNVFAYLVAVLRHAKAVRRRPGDWLPWNYQAQLTQKAA